MMYLSLAFKYQEQAYRQKSQFDTNVNLIDGAQVFFFFNQYQLCFGDLFLNKIY